jgi:hypothetical protein
MPPEEIENPALRDPPSGFESLSMCCRLCGTELTLRADASSLDMQETEVRLRELRARQHLSPAEEAELHRLEVLFSIMESLKVIGGQK